MMGVMPFGFLFVFVLFLGSIVSMSSVHWMWIWVGLELNLMGFIPVLLYRGMIQETEAGMKYFIMQSVGSGMLMMGSLVCYNLSFSWEAVYSGSISFLGVVLLVSGLLIKLGSFPFHFWVPSVMASVSWFGCLLLSTWQKVAPIFLFSAVIQGWKITSWEGSILLLIAGFSVLVGGIGGVNQTQVRAILAYSSIAHLGWMVFCISISDGIFKIYFLVYFSVSVCLFMVLWFVELGFYSQVGSLSVGVPSFGQVFVIFMLLSLGGLPPLLGFVGKFIAIWSYCSIGFLMIVMVLLLGSLISLYYYLSLLFSVMLFSSFSLSVKGWAVSGDLLSLKSSLSVGGTADGVGLKDYKVLFVNSLYNSFYWFLVGLIFLANLIGGGFVGYSLMFIDFL
uniref:NADH-ubiquinone oxidoreductase chain 2 n=1 Tax=Angaria neglecta TaxID=1740283 RepID=A0A0S1F5M6_9VEST|nr:NADH dehydrogenase subunit 2 [Angaria neglecta]ALK03362.1 NADH dehydrogenase subunit 2 [Angaria neglecta]